MKKKTAPSMSKRKVAPAVPQAPVQGPSSAAPMQGGAPMMKKGGKTKKKKCQIMKSGTPKKAPKIAIPSKKRPNSFFKENQHATKGKSPMAPLTGKKLSK